MSLVVSIKTHHGIVISADRRISLEYEKDSIRRFSVVTDNEQKLFVTESGIAIAYVGSSSIPPISAVLEKFCQKFSNDTSLTTIIREMKQVTKNHKISILLFAYENNTPKILSFGSETEQDLSDYPIVYSGAIEVIQSLASFPVNFNFFNLQDAIDYSRFLISTTAKMQSFTEMNQSVSKDCDTIVITPNHYIWIEKNKLHS